MWTKDNRHQLLFLHQNRPAVSSNVKPNELCKSLRPHLEELSDFLSFDLFVLFLSSNSNSNLNSKRLDSISEFFNKWRKSSNATDVRYETLSVLLRSSSFSIFILFRFVFCYSISCLALSSSISLWFSGTWNSMRGRSIDSSFLFLPLSLEFLALLFLIISSILLSSVIFWQQCFVE